MKTKALRNSLSKHKWTFWPKLTKSEWIAVGALYPSGPTNPRCVECGLWNTVATPGMEPDGTGPLHIVTMPTVEDDRIWYRIASGRIGRLIKKYILKPCGLAPSDITIVPAIKCRPSGNVLKRHRTMCAPFLAKDLSGAEKIITLGAEALNAVNLTEEHQVKKSAGLIVSTITGVPVMISYSPAQALLVQKSADGEQNNKWGTLDMIRGHIKQLLSGAVRELPPMEILK